MYLFLVDPANRYRMLEVRARADIQPDDHYTFADKLGKKHGDADLGTMDKPGEQSTVITVHPVEANTYGG